MLTEMDVVDATTPSSTPAIQPSDETPKSITSNDTEPSAQLKVYEKDTSPNVSDISSPPPPLTTTKTTSATPPGCDDNFSSSDSAIDNIPTDSDVAETIVTPFTDDHQSDTLPKSESAENTIRDGASSDMTVISSIKPEPVSPFRETSSDISVFEETLRDANHQLDKSIGSDDATSSDEDGYDSAWDSCGSEDDIIENPYICEECDKKFYSYEALEVHKCIKQYGCPICTKTYDTIGKLVVHTKIHFAARTYNLQKTTPAKRFRLDVDIVCNDAASPLREGDDEGDHKSHRCHICGKDFKHNHKLSAHLRTHSELYKCLVCTRSFSTKHNLKRHCKDVHDMEEYKYELVLLNTPMDLEAFNNTQVRRNTSTHPRVYIFMETAPIPLPPGQISFITGFLAD